MMVFFSCIILAIITFALIAYFGTEYMKTEGNVSDKILMTFAKTIDKVAEKGLYLLGLFTAMFLVISMIKTALGG
jgi:energy-converting hydrogenase Eha subunit F